jgi:hypothetical protein
LQASVQIISKATAVFDAHTAAAAAYEVMEGQLLLETIQGTNPDDPIFVAKLEEGEAGDAAIAKVSIGCTTC